MIMPVSNADSPSVLSTEDKKQKIIDQIQEREMAQTAAFLPEDTNWKIWLDHLNILWKQAEKTNEIWQIPWTCNIHIEYLFPHHREGNPQITVNSRWIASFNHKFELINSREKVLL